MSWILYTVQPGETWFGIAARYGMTAEQMQQANCLSPGDGLQTGQSLYVPWLIAPSPTPCFPPSSWVLYTVQPGENLFRIAQSYGMSAEEMQKANCLGSEVLLAGQTIHVPYVISIPASGGEGAAGSEPEIITGLRDEIYFEGGGGDGVFCHNVHPQPGDPLPMVRVYRGAPLDNGVLCLFGFPRQQQLTVVLRSPGGDSFSALYELQANDRVIQLQPTAEIPVEGFFWTVPDISGPEILEIPLWWPVGLPTGMWSIRVNNYPESLFDFAYEGPAVSTMPDTSINPFISHECGTYSAGDQVLVRGASFGPNVVVHYGIYLRGTDFYTASLVGDGIVTTDNQGSFSTVFRIESTDPSGTFFFIPVLDPDIEEYKLDSMNIACYQVP